LAGSFIDHRKNGMLFGMAHPWHPEQKRRTPFAKWIVVDPQSDVGSEPNGKKNQLNSIRSTVQASDGLAAISRVIQRS